METFPQKINIHTDGKESENKLYSLSEKRSERNLSGFSEDEKQVIYYRLKVLSSLVDLIGKDLKMPVELNEPGKGWYWDFENNIVRVDPKELLEKDNDYLRFVMCHEAGHRRISRADFIPSDMWQQIGFAFMSNAIEDPRDNNFIIDAYPGVISWMDAVYQEEIDFEHKLDEKAKEKLGTIPMFKQAGYEYIKQWYREIKGLPVEIDDNLPEEVKKVVKKTIDSARRSWQIYPTKAEADAGEELILEDATASYEVNRDEVWPDFQTLVENDVKNQSIQEMLQDMIDKIMDKGEGSDQKSDKGLLDQLSSEEKEELKNALEEAVNELLEKDVLDTATEKKNPVVDLDSISSELKKKLTDYIDQLPEEVKKDLMERAEKSLSEYEEILNEYIAGKMSEFPYKQEASHSQMIDKEEPPLQEVSETRAETSESGGELPQETDRKVIEDIFEDKNDPYHKALGEIGEMIDDLTSELRDVFIKRKIGKNETGYRYGRRINIPERVREKIAGIPLIKTQSKEKREMPSEERDYALTIMIDLSGSMKGEKIQEAFKSAIVLSETLTNLGMKFEVVGFQDILLEFKSFEADYDDRARSKMNQLLLEVEDNNPHGHNKSEDNDDGACLMSASKRLEHQQTKNQILIVLSDGEPMMGSGIKSSDQLHREMLATISYIEKETNQKLIGVGILSDAVTKYYTNNVPDISAEELPVTVSDILKQLIE